MGLGHGASPSQCLTLLQDDEAKLISNNLIQLFDSKFKHHLDRYKYAAPDIRTTSEVIHQDECLRLFFCLLTNLIDPNPWIFGEKISLLDISILPFIRQCKIANPALVFRAQNFKQTIGLLEYFESSELFNIGL